VDGNVKVACSSMGTEISYIPVDNQPGYAILIRFGRQGYSDLMHRKSELSTETQKLSTG